MGSEIQSRKEGWRRAVPGEKHERGKSKQEGQTQDPGSSGFGGRGYILGSVIERWIGGCGAWAGCCSQSEQLEMGALEHLPNARIPFSAGQSLSRTRKQVRDTVPCCYFSINLMDH